MCVIVRQGVMKLCKCLIEFVFLNCELYVEKACVPISKNLKNH